ncbi:MAG: hypothetical protein GXP13_06610, partial [Gammaproteobacteria bacterium]|nr:hypothetical protein [Gammaproteobacteria bacterium]
VLEESGSEKKPGFREILYKPEYDLILQAIVLPVLRVFPHLNKYFLRNLLYAAFRYSSLSELLCICQQHIDLEKNMPVANRVYWLSTAYLLSPEEHETILFDYVGRTREKALPLLDYVDALMSSGDQRLNITSDMLANLIYMVAPKFKPVRDKFGNLDDNVQKIIRLFDALHSDKSTSARQAISKLRKIRVMRLYSDYLG